MALKLEVFDTARNGAAATVVIENAALEEERLAAFDKGYAAGWEDAAAAQSDDQARIRADLNRHLQSLGFTLQEAQSHVLTALRPLILDIVGKLLPEVARETLAPIVLETLIPMAEEMVDAPIGIVLNPAARHAVEALLTQATGLPLEVKEEPTLGEGQVYLRLGATEARVDLDRAVGEITASVRAFFDLAERRDQNG